MSVVISTESAVLLSHEIYLNQLYNHLGFVVDHRLFSINCPYIKENQPTSKNSEPLKRKRRKKVTENSTDGNLDEIKTEIGNIEDTYRKFNEFLIKNKVFGNDDNCVPETMRNDSCLELVEEFNLNTHSNGIKFLKAGNTLPNSIRVSIDHHDYLIPPNCVFYCNDICKIDEFLDVETSKFDLIVLDPPWWNKYIRRIKAVDKSLGYLMMDNDKIKTIPIEKLIKNDGLVVIWCTNSMMNIDAINKDFLPKWKLKPVCTWIWMKITNRGIPVCKFKQPLAKQPYERIVIACHEDIHCSKYEELAKLKLILSVPSAIHSHKPPLIELLKEYLPAKPSCLEIFARSLLPNFTSIGLEVLKLQNFKLFQSSE